MAEKTGYGKRPFWQWILIYIVIGGIIYLGIYYFFIKGKYNYSNNYSNPSVNSYPSTNQYPSASQSAPTAQPSYSNQGMQQNNAPNSYGY